MRERDALSAHGITVTVLRMIPVGTLLLPIVSVSLLVFSVMVH